MTGAAATTNPLRPSVALTALLGLIFDGLDRDAHGICDVGRGVFLERFGWRPAALAPGVWPERLTREVAFDPVPELAVSGCAFDPKAERPIATRVVWSEVSMPPSPPRRVGRLWHDVEVLPETEAAARAGLATMPPPTAVIHAVWSLFALWALDVPVVLDDRATMARVQALQLATAEATGGRFEWLRLPLPGGCTREPGVEPPAVTLAACDPRRVALRLPGSRNLDYITYGARVRLELIDPARVYGIDVLEEAAGAAVERAAAAAAKGKVRA